MKEYVELIIGGVGGQGVVTGGALLGKAAVEYAGLNAVASSEYGVETRGTFTKSSILISTGNIYYTEAVAPDLVIVMAEVAYEKYVETLKEESLLVYDNSVIHKESPSDCEQIGFPITEAAREIGHEGVANSIAAGIIIGLTQVMDKTIMEQVLSDQFGSIERVKEMNIKAFNKGYTMSTRRVARG
jgi:2-oxoglutarate ferredoxin oxidoreductase subunit gamma